MSANLVSNFVTVIFRIDFLDLNCKKSIVNTGSESTLLPGPFYGFEFLRQPAWSSSMSFLLERNYLSKTKELYLVGFFAIVCFRNF